MIHACKLQNVSQVSKCHWPRLSNQEQLSMLQPSQISHLFFFPWVIYMSKIFFSRMMQTTPCDVSSWQNPRSLSPLRTEEWPPVLQYIKQQFLFPTGPGSILKNKPCCNLYYTKMSEPSIQFVLAGPVRRFETISEDWHGSSWPPVAVAAPNT